MTKPPQNDVNGIRGDDDIRCHHPMSQKTMCGPKSTNGFDHGQPVDQEIMFLNERFASFYDEEEGETVYVGFGDLVSGKGYLVTAIYSPESLKRVVLQAFPHLASTLEAWMSTPDLRGHHLAGVSFDRDADLDQTLYLPVQVDEHALPNLDEYGPLFARALQAKANDVTKGFQGAPTILLVNPDTAMEQYELVVHHLKSVVGEHFVGSGVTYPSPTDLIHVLPPTCDTSKTRKTLQSHAPDHTWQIAVMTPSQFPSLAVILPPHLLANNRLLVLSVTNDWETNRADEIRFHALPREGRKIFRALARNSWPSQPETCSVATLATNLRCKTGVDQLPLALITFVGASTVSYSQKTMTIPGRERARKTFCTVTGLSLSVFS